VSIPLFGSIGALFDRLGKVGALIENLYSYQQTQLTAMTDTTTGVVGQLNEEPDVQAIQGSSYISILNSSAGTLSGTVQNLAAAIINRMVFRDSPRFNQTLESQNTLASLQEIILQMREQGATVLAMTVTATPSAFIGEGDGIINASTKRPLDGLTLENAFSEELLFTCVADSYSGGATAGK
jgi:hypothetical protein